ncbi:Tim44 domain-containing protein [Hydrogenovibrio kuenenii]|uniref:Tim44 domain-containing protein n=1 Tax=Hydrogenovibrio kuenenii TaxID=63658 RepID=UPI000466CB4E|nr:TIM44-like domain-containing protein [Hydrogenovibrio kuenenii]
MKRTLILIMTLVSFLAFAQVAEAKRFGFGGSYGYSKKIAPQQYSKRPASPNYQKAKPQASAGQRPASGASRWLGPLAGIAAGGLLAAMLFGDGFQGIQPFDILIFILIAFVLMSFFRRRQQPVYTSSYDQRAGEAGQPAYRESYEQQYEQNPQTAPSHNLQGSMIGSAISDDAQSVEEMPSWFNKDDFLENAKHHFVEVQKAWDAQDLTEIRAYCAPELIDALEKDMQGVDMAANFTQVDELRADIADTVVDGNYFIVSVRFSGFIVEEQGGFAHAFNEIWHIRRLTAGEGDWQIAGIQQTA